MRILLTSICLVLCTSIANAQLSIGAHAGYTLAWQNYGDIELPEDAITHIHSYHTAIDLNYRLSDRFSLGAEPGFTQRGAACEPGWNFGTAPTFRGDSKLLLKYLNLPVLLRTHFTVGKSGLELIPSLGYSISAGLLAHQEIIDLDTKDVIEKSRIWLGDFSRINSLDHGAQAGLRVAKNFENKVLYAEASFYAGMRDAERFNFSKNRALDIGLGCLFTL